jgi:hypothetical protein
MAHTRGVATRVVVVKPKPGLGDQANQFSIKQREALILPLPISGMSLLRIVLRITTK